ncbi:MAG: DegT/DnrJ/EryC1/StrS family aminotransferase [Candidatus Hodarchaeales archaeon]|jgi:CDP-6-deoxy-D-xylo-4-hexulose-3-dehydrase
MKWISIGDFNVSSEGREAINKVIDTGRVTEHKKVLTFEKEFSKFLETKFTILTNSGTSALILGLEALKNLKVTPGTNVVTTPLTYAATINAIKITGFNPVFVDVDPKTFVITPDNIEIKLEEVDNIEEFSIILPVHLMGYPAAMDKINRICKKYGIISFEDSAQAHGTLYQGKKCGSYSITSAFSFYIAHNIQVGEMGALTTNDGHIAKLARRLKANGRMCDCQICTRSQGICPYKENDIDPRFTHTHIGYNFKTTEFMASIGLVQLSRIDTIIQQRRENVRILNDGLENLSETLHLPPFSDDISYMAYPLVLTQKSNISRNKLSNELENKGIETRPLFSCIPTQQPSYKDFAKKYQGKLPNAENIGKNGLYIGCHQFLEEDDLNYIIKTFHNILG